MAEHLEISIITAERISELIWSDQFALKFDTFVYSGALTFFENKKVLFHEYPLEDIWEYDLSLEAHCLFKRTNIFEKIKLLASDLDEIFKQISFKFAFANIETNSNFRIENGSPTKEMILKSALIFLPKSMLSQIEINLRHHIFEAENIVCLYNPRTILFSSSCEKLKILKESSN